VARSPALGKVIGLAYVHPEDAEAGKAIEIKLDSGQTVRAAVAALPFYDAGNARQEM
jgi:sarcosine oxidase subunit alpha